MTANFKSVKSDECTNINFKYIKNVMIAATMGILIILQNVDIKFSIFIKTDIKF